MRRAMVELGGLCLLLAVAMVAVPASASAVTFGADLNRTPNNTATCLNLQLIVVADTCTVESTNPATGESGFPPGGEGRVSEVKVRVGPVTGPMQIVVEQAVRQDNPFEAGKPNYACCKVIDASPIFTPDANSITTVPVDFRVTQAITPDENGLYLDQHLALSVLAPNVPIPANLDNNSSVGSWFPAWQNVGEERVGPNGSPLNAQVLFSAEWNPIGGGGGDGGNVTPTPTPTVTPAPALLPRRLAPVRGGAAVVPLLCRLDQACVGRLLLQNRRAGGAANAASTSAARRGAARRRGAANRRGRNRHPRVTTYAAVRFRIPAGKRKAIRVPLRRLARRVLRKRPQFATWANVSINGQLVAPKRIVVRRAAVKRRGGNTKRPGQRAKRRARR